MAKLFFGLLLLTSCGYAPMTTEQPLIINEIETSLIGNDCKCLCNYYGNNHKGSSRVVTLASPIFKLTDTCSKFQIGDTLQIITHP